MAAQVDAKDAKPPYAFKRVDAYDGGIGAFATRDLKRGEVILHEAPLVVATMSTLETRVAALDEKTRKKRRYREARIAAGKDPDKQDADDLQKAIQERKQKAAKGLSALKQKFRKAVLGTGVALVAFANDMKDAMWKEDAF